MSAEIAAEVSSSGETGAALAAGEPTNKSNQGQGATSGSAHGAVKQLLLANFTHAHILATIHLLRGLREKLVGIDRIKQLISEGMTPEQMPFQLATQQDMASTIKLELSRVIDDLALGYAIAQTAAQSKAHGFEGQGLISDTAKRVKKKPLPPAYDPATEPIDYFPLHAFVVEQKKSGTLANDPAWINDSKKQKNWWDARLAKSLGIMNTRFNDTLVWIDFTIQAARSRALLKDVSPDVISTLVHDCHDANAQGPTGSLTSGPACPTGPAEPAVSGSTASETSSRPPYSLPPAFATDGDRLIRLGSTARHKLLANFEAATRLPGSTADQIARAYHLLLEHAGVRTKWAIAWGEALLEAQKYYEAAAAFSVAIESMSPTHTGRWQEDTNGYSMPLKTVREVASSLLSTHADEEEEDGDDAESQGSADAQRSTVTKEAKARLKAMRKRALLLRARSREAIWLSERGIQPVSEDGTVALHRSLETLTLEVQDDIAEYSSIKQGSVHQDDRRRKTAETDRSDKTTSNPVSSSSSPSPPLPEGLELDAEAAALLGVIRTDYEAVLNMDQANIEAKEGVARISRWSQRPPQAGA